MLEKFEAHQGIQYVRALHAGLVHALRLHHICGGLDAIGWYHFAFQSSVQEWQQGPFRSPRDCSNSRSACETSTLQRPANNLLS